MYSKVSGGSKAILSVLFLILNALVALATGVIFAYMSDHGCSRAFIAVCVLSFIYLIINVLLISCAKAWERSYQWAIFICLIAIVIVSLIGLGYSAAQSVCDINVCGESYAKDNDDFYEWFNKKDRKSDYEDRVCDQKVADEWIADSIVASMSYYSMKNAGDSFYIKRGWPISFSVFQSILSFIHLIATFLNLYSCKGCKPNRTSKGIAYF